MTGIDLSEKSIEEARLQENERLHFFVHDMRRPCWINFFDYAFNFFTSFGYFETLRENNDVLGSIAGSLKKGGVFVMDYLNVPYAETHLKPNSDEEKDDCRFMIRRTGDAGHFIKEITVTDKKTNRTFNFAEKVAKFRKKDLAEMLEARGMEIIETFGDYSLSAYDERNSPRLILISRKCG